MLASLVMNGHWLLDRLWEHYMRDVPYARTFEQLNGGQMRNDHVAFRSLGRPGDGIDTFAQLFRRFGWEPRETYTFPDAHLNALYLGHPGGLPRIFISQIELSELPAEVADLLSRAPLPPPPPPEPDALVQWFFPEPTPITREELDLVESHSQYGAWVLLFGRRVNHFTGTVSDIEKWQARMQQMGVPMKSVIEGDRNGPLRQTATAAAKVAIQLDGESLQWPYAYLEIAERKPEFDGFLGPQARQLFDMTQRPAPAG